MNLNVTYLYSAPQEPSKNQKIYAQTEIIGNDAKNWFKVGKLSERGQKAYYQQRDDLKDKLHQLNIEILNRQPTWWEEIKDACIKFVEIVISNLPILRVPILEILADRLGLSSPVKKLLKWF